MIKSLINFFFYIFPVKNNKIMFECGRNRVDDNPLAIYRYIKNNCPKDFIVKFMVKKGTNIDNLDFKDVCYYRTFSGLYNLATSKYWIRSQSLGSVIKKKTNQIYIQMWHGPGGFKRMGNDITGETKIVDHAKDWDCLISTDEFNKKIMCSSTGISPKIVEVLGSASSDILVNYDEKYFHSIKKKLKIDFTNKKIILYAPTFRDDELNNLSIDLKFISLAKLKDYIFLIRLHPLMGDRLKNVNLPNNFINVCNYPDITDLMIISDALITDYSGGVLFHYTILKRPVIFYPYDIDKYSKDRGFYFDYSTFVPGPIVYNEKELFNLFNNSKNIFNKSNIDKIKKFSKKYNKLNDGKVCCRFVNLLKKKYFDKYLKGKGGI